MRPHLLQWFHKKAPKLRQGAPQISRRRDDVRLMMNARSRWWWCWYSTPKMKRNREGGETRLGIATAKAAFGNFFRAPTTAFISYTTHIQTHQRTESYRGFLLRSTTLSKGRCGKQLTVNTRLYHTHNITFFHTKGKRRKSSYSILTGKTFGDIDSYLLLLVFLWKCGILTEKLCELRACPISHLAWLIKSW